MTAGASTNSTWISIHALPEEGDMYPHSPLPQHKISIHALREEGDFLIHTKAQVLYSFLSTPSARRATFHTAERRNVKLISIHALREEGDSIGDFFKTRDV